MASLARHSLVDHVMASRSSVAVLLGALVMAAGCGVPALRPDLWIRPRAWALSGPDSVLGVDSSAVAVAIRRWLAGERPPRLPVAHWEHIRRLYGAYGNTSLWFRARGLNDRRVTGLVKALVEANTDGLDVEEYAVDDIARSIASIREASQPTADEIAAADVLLTTAYVALASDLLSGQHDPRSLSQAWHVRRGQERLDSAVARSLRDDNLASALARMRPSDESYAALRGQLLAMRAIVDRGGWPKVPDGPTLSPGDVDAAARLAVLRQRLLAQGIDGGGRVASVAGRGPTVSADSGVYDQTLAGAVARFQSRHGIDVDSILGPETVAAMNVAATYRLGQIAANLERLRWLPHSLGDRYILVNVPSFRLVAHDSSGRALEMKVIVGQEYGGRRTPVFADSMEYVVFRPYWNVPPGIQTRELEPKIAADPGFMARGNYEYQMVNGRTSIRQLPGEGNALGVVKFMFPNDFNVYLHDTPQDELFTEDVRAFSHGCIRLEKPERLAEWVLGWTKGRVRDAVRGKDDHRVNLPRKVPVYIAYLTAYVRDGELYYGNDLYDRDDAMVKVVAGGALPSAGARGAIDSLRKLLD
jgi:murein L,D-transpeptidase YcbB/YkuD